MSKLAFASANGVLFAVSVVVTGSVERPEVTVLRATIMDILVCAVLYNAVTVTA